MNSKSYGRGRRLLRVAIALLMATTFAGEAAAQGENIGTSRQELVGGTLITAEDQERYALLTLGTGCSASLLRNNWVITAAHCIDRPNPDRPGQFITVPENSVTLRADWPNPQVRQSVRIITFRPNDVAIIRVDSPFTVNRSNGAFNRDVFRGGELVSLPIRAFGRGINRFAFGSGANATPSLNDRRYRIGLFTVTSVDGERYYYSGTAGPTVAGGDSGGPSFVLVGGNLLLVGVHSRCEITCLEGQMCGAWSGPGPAPAGYSNWRWVSATPECGDATIAPVWNDIDRYLGAFVPTPPEVIRSIGRTAAPIKSIVTRTTRTPPTPGPPRTICDAARDARARNSPAAPNLEAQCRAAGGDSSAKAPPTDIAQLDALAVKGEAIAELDPLSVELRNQQREGLARRGFDIGMAAAEGQTLPGPNKQRIHDSLSPTEQAGFRTAVAFSLERNKNAVYAAKGAAIAEADTIVAAARVAEADVFYWLGFDIATGIFGDPALGAQGNTQTGPNSLGIRNALSGAGQRGFNAAVALHLSRDYSRTAPAPADMKDLDPPATRPEEPVGSGRSDGPSRRVRQGGRRRGDAALSKQILCRGSDDRIRLEGSTELHSIYFFKTIGSRIDSTGATILTIELGANTAVGGAGYDGTGLGEGQCAWMDRPVEGEVGVRIRFEVPANAQLTQALHGTPVDTSPTAAERFPDASNIPIYFTNLNNYWIFTAEDTGRGYLQALDSRHWKRTPGMSDRLTRPIETKGVNRDDRVLSPTRP